MIPLWFGIVSFMLIAYVVLDGRNFGAGMLHWLVAKTPQERRQVIAAIGPLWSWHEVWLVGFRRHFVRRFSQAHGLGFCGLLPGAVPDFVVPHSARHFHRVAGTSTTGFGKGFGISSSYLQLSAGRPFWRRGRQSGAGSSA